MVSPQQVKISGYNSNFWQISHCISEMRIVTVEGCNEWCYFQWPWVTPKYPKPPHFIVRRWRGICCGSVSVLQSVCMITDRISAKGNVFIHVRPFVSSLCFEATDLWTCFLHMCVGHDHSWPGSESYCKMFSFSATLPHFTPKSLPKKGCEEASFSQTRITFIETHISSKLHLVGIRASTAWDFSQDLGILMVNLGFRDFAGKSLDF